MTLWAAPVGLMVGRKIEEKYKFGLSLGRKQMATIMQRAHGFALTAVFVFVGAVLLGVF